MKSSLLTALLFALAPCLLLSAGETLVAEWNFAKGSPLSSNGKYMGKLMGKTTITGNAKEGYRMIVGKSGKDVQEGMQITSKDKALAPADGFRLEMTFQMQEPTSTQSYLMLWDNKGVPHSPNAANPAWHNGFCLFLVRRGETIFQPMVLIGHGKYSSQLAGKYMKLAEGVKHTIVLTYDGVSKIAVAIDGKDAGKITAKQGGKVSAPQFFLQIGDRSGSGPYYRFDGDILNVKLYSLK